MRPVNTLTAARMSGWGRAAQPASKSRVARLMSPFARRVARQARSPGTRSRASLNSPRGRGAALPPDRVARGCASAVSTKARWRSAVPASIQFNARGSRRPSKARPPVLADRMMIEHGIAGPGERRDAMRFERVSIGASASPRRRASTCSPRRPRTRVRASRPCARMSLRAVGAVPASCAASALSSKVSGFLAEALQSLRRSTLRIARIASTGPRSCRASGRAAPCGAGAPRALAIARDAEDEAQEKFQTIAITTMAPHGGGRDHQRGLDLDSPAR